VTSETLRCRELMYEMEAYVMGELDPAREDLFAVHLMGCTRCAAEAGLAERVEAELAALPPLDAPPELIERIKARAREEAPATVVSMAARRPRPSGRSVLWPVALAAMLLTALALSFRHGEVPRTGPTAVEVAHAEQEARYALALVARLGRKASTELRDEVFMERVVAPVGRSLSRNPVPQPAKPGGLES